MSSFVRNYGEMIYRGILLLLVLGNAWLCVNFTAKADFEALRSAVFDIKTSLVRMESNGAILADHEARIRQLEHLYPLHVGILKETSYYEWVSGKSQQIKLVKNDNNQQSTKDN